MSETFLTPEEIGELTGYSRKADQRRQLGHMGIRFHVNCCGRPIVMRDALLHPVNVSVERRQMPDLEALEELSRGQEAHKG